MTDQKNVLSNSFETLEISEYPNNPSSNHSRTPQRSDVLISNGSNALRLGKISESGINPFKDIPRTLQGSETVLSNGSDTLGFGKLSKSIPSNVSTVQSQNTLEELLKKTIQPGLDAQRTIERISPNHPFFRRAEKLVEEHCLPREGFGNFKRLLCGIREFPCILLQNPKNDFLEFETMVRTTFTLSWIDEALKELGLNIDDIIIMDLFPMLTDEWLTNNPDKRLQAIHDMFELTLDFIHEFKLPIILSCQCFKAKGSSLWASFKHTKAGDLRSSMNSAQNKKVSRFKGKGHIAYVVHGFHPASLSYQGRKKDNGQNEAILRDILHSLFGPYAVFRRAYETRILEGHEKYQGLMRKSIEALHRRATRLGDIREQGLALGLFQDYDDSKIHDDWNDLKNALDPILKNMRPRTFA
jgi:hypothetical protein